MTNSQILEEAAEWVVTLRDGEADAHARTEFTAWLCKSPEHVRAYLELTSIWAEAAAPDVLRTLDRQALVARACTQGNVVALQDSMSAPHEANEASSCAPLPLEAVTRQRTSGRFARVRRRGLFAAAALAALMAGGAVWWQTHRFPTYVAGIGEQRSIVLADGSVVELNSRSRIRVRFSADERVVELLEGQGLFNVEKDPQRPFIVRSDDARVRAVGTRFDVNRKPHRTLVTVLEGRVEVRTAPFAVPGPASDKISSAPFAQGRAPGESGRTVVELQAGQQVTVAADRITPPRAANLAAATAWTERQLVFESAPLIDVAQEFNRYNARQLVIDAQLEGMLVSGVFSSTDPSSLLRFLREQPDVSVRETQSQIRISRGE